jgi:predicted kinase
MPLVVQMHGVPGSGKSTLARALAPRIDAVVLDKDVIKAALLEAGINERLAAAGAYEAYFSLARALVAQERALILDNPVYWPRVEEQWLRLAEAAGSPAVLLECVCPDDAELVRRLATRPALASQPREPLDLTRHAGAAPTSFAPRLVLDTLRPLAGLVEDARRYIDAARHASRDAAAAAMGRLP